MTNLTVRHPSRSTLQGKFSSKGTQGVTAFFDTNVLVYCNDPKTSRKQTIALALVEQYGVVGDAAISTQVLIELYNVLVNKQKVSRKAIAVGCAIGTPPKSTKSLPQRTLQMLPHIAHPSAAAKFFMSTKPDFLL
jgi:predicted nucleic acid-binding protein